MTVAPSPRRTRRAALFVAAALAGVALAPAAAPAAADIEGTWSFSGGEVVVAAQADGSFLGTVIRPTRFSNCVHPNGEQMWTGLRLQPDGQYWGKHQWFNTATCAYIERGNTAFRTLTKPDGQKFLRVCFAGPEFPETQPSIDAAGASTGTTTGCQDSDLLAPPAAPTTPNVNTIATLPSQGKKKCLSKRSFRIRLKEPKGDALDSAKVFVNGKLVRTIKRDRITAPVNLKGLPKGRYTVKITAKTVLGKTISGTRKYRTCTKKKTSKSKSRV